VIVLLNSRKEFDPQPSSPREKAIAGQLHPALVSSVCQ
jgi:hypothetical protein